MHDAGFGNKSYKIHQRRYLGSKKKLLEFIDEILKNEKIDYSVFADIFAGTGVVGIHNARKSNVILNDILDSNYKAYLAFAGSEKINTDLLKRKINDFNTLDVSKLKENYFSRNFSNTYYDHPNSIKIGHIREEISKLKKSKKINVREEAYLVTSLLYSMDRIANTVGHYDAYRKIAIPKKNLYLLPLDTLDSNFTVSIFKKDANTLAKEIKSDVIYIDPPYNSRQYSDSYHLLENVSEWKKKPVKGVALKFDRSHIKSAYSLKSAAQAFSDLISNLDTRYILVSYNDMGNTGDARSQSRISDNELISTLEAKGRVKVFEQVYKQFTTGRSTNSELKERVFFCEVGKSAKKKNARSSKNSAVKEYVKSPLNYTGGKYRLLQQITPFFPEEINHFYDVFCGGANVGINAKAKKIVCIDNNTKLVRLLNLIKNTNFEKLNKSILKIIDNSGLSQSFINGYDYYNCESSRGLGKYNKESFLKLREKYNNTKTSTLKDTILLTLIFYGFNNQIRFNSKNQYNLPVGKRDYNGKSRKNLSSFNRVSNEKNIEFVKGDFRELLSLNLHNNDFVYLDPPYLLGLATYNENNGWNLETEKQLYEVLDHLNNKGIKFALSNVTQHKGRRNEILLDWINRNDLKVNYMNYDYKNSNYQSKASTDKTVEVLITNY